MKLYIVVNKYGLITQQTYNEEALTRLLKTNCFQPECKIIPIESLTLTEYKNANEKEANPTAEITERDKA